MMNFESLPPTGDVRIRRALLSCFRKDEAISLAQQLHVLGVSLVASGGTADAIAKAGLPVERTDRWTGFDDLLAGRVKTLHPTLYAGVLARAGSASDDEDLRRHQIDPFDLIAIDLYPFERTSEQRTGEAATIELIDVGGVSLIRAAAKNFDRVTVLCRAEVFGPFSELIAASEGIIGRAERRRLAALALQWTSFYDGCIAGWLENDDSGFPGHFGLPLMSDLDLRYGENPHQKAQFYRLGGQGATGVAGVEVLGGKQLSFNNLLDLDIALRLPREFERPTVAILKHTTPCGIGQGATAAEACKMARSTDPVSAFGGIAGFNCPVDEEAAKVLREGFMEVVAAPDYTEIALKELRKSKNLRIIRLSGLPPAGRIDMRTVWGGVLMQEDDFGFPELEEAKVVTRLQPDPAQWEALRFAWKSVRYVKSNAILLADGDRTLGIGAGQMSRVDAAHIAIWKAGQSGLALDGCVAASDAFFPFRDGIDLLIDAGVKVVVQPGGSMRDAEVIAAADERGIAMVFTGRRHFRH
ncbi:MAG: bifunctional phosphoribosylaminoimidazolecarboxamide formyltransferase/IMP cyclohydrolase [Calditrichaeota bacterium]|nr:bifunctional phosphoribosylaminoimidazolecarboxamide formyltransferase/IMP cyclohydrolase [Calditrichota bacterium]